MRFALPYLMRRYEKIAGGERLPAAGRHLDQGPGVVVGERFFEILNGIDLHGPEASCVQWRHGSQVGPHLRVQHRQTDQFLGPVKREDLPAAGERVEVAGELGYGTGGLEGERQRQVIVRQAIRQPGCVLGRLDFDARQGMTFRLGLNNADCLGVGVEHVVGVAGLERELPNSNARCRHDVHRPAIQNLPATRLKLAVDLLAGLLLWCFLSHAAASSVNPWAACR